MRCLGLDLGSKTLGLAISDTTNLVATVYKTIYFKDEDYLSIIPELSEIVTSENIDTIVLGLPKNMNNTLGERANISLEFKKIIENKLNIKVVLEDERLTSVISNNILIQADVSRKKRKKKVDGLAATLILQSYLDKERNKYGR